MHSKARVPKFKKMLLCFLNTRNERNPSVKDIYEFKQNLRCLYMEKSDTEYFHSFLSELYVCSRIILTIKFFSYSFTMFPHTKH